MTTSRLPMTAYGNPMTQMIATYCEDLARTGTAHPDHASWGVVWVWDRALPLDARMCAVLDKQPWPFGVCVIRRPDSR